MLSEKRFMIVIETKKGDEFNFFGTIYKSSEPEELFLPPENFYKKFGGKIPEGNHHEIQWTGLPSICKNVEKGLIHIHEENQKNFVCWTKQVSTEEESFSVIKVASLGILYSTKTCEDFAKIFAECKNSMEETIKKLIELCELKYEPKLIFDETTIEGMLRHNTLNKKIFFL